MLSVAEAFVLLSPLLSPSLGALINFEEIGGIPGANLVTNLTVTWHNGKLLNSTLASLKSGDTLSFPNKVNLVCNVRLHAISFFSISDLSNDGRNLW